MIGYRLYGHNELDEPGFTQPLMYEKIRARKTPPTMYAEHLVEDGIIDEAGVQKIKDQVNKYFETEWEKSKEYTPSMKDFKNPKYRGSRTLTHKWVDMVLS